MNMTADELRSRNLRTVAALAALFVLPLLISFWLYYATAWRPAGSTIHGELITPARPLPALAFQGNDSSPANPNVFNGKWTLVYVGNGQCDEACRRALLVMRQTRLSLNNDMTRVNRVFLSTNDCCNRDFLNREHTGLMALDASAPGSEAVLPHFPAEDQSHMLFVVDPLGNLMMRYDARQNPKGLLQDLKKLLKLSHIG